MTRPSIAKRSLHPPQGAVEGVCVVVSARLPPPCPVCHYDVRVLVEQRVNACRAAHALANADERRALQPHHPLAVGELLRHPLDAQPDSRIHRELLDQPREHLVQAVANGHSQIGAVVPRARRPAFRVVNSCDGGVGLSPIDAA